jgi:retinol dehydrogenase 12
MSPFEWEAIDLTDRLCVVTGANSGVGYEVAKGLARAGADLVLGCRSVERGNHARDALRAETGNSKIHCIQLDLSAPQSVRAFAEAIKALRKPLKVLVNNGAVMKLERELTPDGHELNFATNHLGPFLLTHLLLETLKQAAPSRIVNVSSNAHAQGKLDFDDLKLERKFGGFPAYARSKLANLVAARELALRLEGSGVTLNSVHPGGVASNFNKDFKGAAKIIFGLVKLFLSPPEKGAQTPLYLASARALEGVTARYFVDLKEAKPLKLVEDRAFGARVWDLSVKLTDVSEALTKSAQPVSQENVAACPGASDR